ncbi:hypothetical protein SAMN05216251_102521 [Actinacidiphila alni]|uniref:Uncharacterized protein n=1 Tax=Actinacidiphila alni TaxID=380248 RepID=A0A1I1ZNT9_9ACTN|nr:hypothetical protein [Actinacidiphila alni]SFE33315.1 hypothetical protein SAMN05216251_102521 [Actinacidiphila alni]
MDQPTMPANPRVLIVGRSPGVITGAADLLRGKGFRADATNLFADVLTAYDSTALDIVVFGGMVPPPAKQQLMDEISRSNGRVVFVQGLAGIPGLVAAQVEGAASSAPGTPDDARYDAATRTVRLTLREPADVTVDAWWISSFAPPEPTSTSLRVTAGDGPLAAGEHAFALPAEVPAEASFVTVRVGPAVHAFTVGAIPESIRRLATAGTAGGPPALPPVRPVATHDHG